MAHNRRAQKKKPKIANGTKAKRDKFYRYAYHPEPVILPKVAVCEYCGGVIAHYYGCPLNRG